MDLRSWAATAEGYTRHLLTTGKSEQTVRTYVNVVSLFWRWCEQHESCPIDIEREGVRTWIIYRAGEVSSAKVHSDISGLRSFYEYLKDEGVRTDNPAEKVKWKRTETLPTAPLDMPEVKALLRACTTERDRLIILLLVYSGVRITEFASMEARDIDWSKGLITIRHGKGDVARHVQPAPEIMDRLHIYLGLIPPSGGIWRSLRPGHAALKAHQIRKRIYWITKRAGLENVHPHRFRSTFACEFLDQFDGDIHALKGAMGHKSIDTTARYAKAAELRRGLAKMSRFNLPGLTA